MSIIVKTGLLLGGGFVIATGSYFAISGLGYSPVTLNEEESTNTDYNGKIDNDFKYFLASPFNKKNVRFWNERFQALKTSTDLSTEFTKDSKVVKAFAEDKTGNTNNDDKALNRVCHNLYTGKSKTDLSISDSESDKKKLTTDLFAYCSVLGGLPKTVKEVATGKTTHPYSDNTIGKTNEAKLVFAEGNDRWWELKNEEFYAGSAPTNDEFFKKLHTDEKNKQSKKSLRTWCEQAYGKESSNTTSATEKPTSTETLKYCSLLGS